MAPAIDGTRHGARSHRAGPAATGQDTMRPRAAAIATAGLVALLVAACSENTAEVAGYGAAAPEFTIAAADTPEAPADAALAYEHDATVTLAARSEEHTSELQSRENLVCRLLLEKKK